MTWEHGLEILFTRSAHYRAFQRLCADSNVSITQRDAYRALVIRRAMGVPDEHAPATLAPIAFAGGGCGSC